MDDACPNVIVDSEFADRIPRLRDEEMAALEASILAEGCRDALVVWGSENILLDGHHRLGICRTHNIEYSLTPLEFESRAAAMDWIDRNQLGRRNLNPADFAIIVGRIYNRRKKPEGRPPGQLPQVEGVSETAEAIADELGVSRATVERHGQRASVHDAMKALGDKDAAEEAKGAPQAVIAEVARMGPSEAAHALKSVGRVHVENNSGHMEWYTPPEIIEAAKAVMGHIDLDPCSSDIAQTIVGATTYYTEADDGLERPWAGRVWMNPPYANGLVGRFIDTLIASIEAGDVTEAIAITNNATDTQWFQSACPSIGGLCLVSGRVRYLDSSLVPAKTPLQGQMILYFGDRVPQFRDVFSRFGSVWVCI